LGATLKEELSGAVRWSAISAAWGCSGGNRVGARQTDSGPVCAEKKVTNRVLGAAVRNGLFFYPATGMAGKAGGDAMMITPPFIIGDAEIDYIIRIARAALDEIHPSL